METLKDKYFPVLDNGFVAVKDWMGNDGDIVQMARCSYGSGTKAVSSDRGLIRTLMREAHTSPFERCEIVLHVGLPIFVARQWIRHRTANVNEYSGRYSVMPMIFYTPPLERHQKQHKRNKQGSSQEVLSQAEHEKIAYASGRVRDEAIDCYKVALECDLAREIARIDLPLSMYTYWYWKIDAHNLLHFLRLRLDQHAQWEIRQYAKVIAGIFKVWLPYTWEAFQDYVLGDVSFSRQEQIILKKVMGRNDFSFQDPSDKQFVLEEAKALGLSDREMQQFITKMNLDVEAIDYALDLSTARHGQEFEALIRENSLEQ